MPRLKLSNITQSISNIYRHKLSDTVVEATKNRITNDSLKLITNITEDMRDHIGELLRQGEEAGRSVSATASTLLKTGLDEGVFKSARKRAYLIARTELHRARQAAAIDIFKASGIKVLKWVGIPEDGRICDKCKAKHNKHYNIDNITETPPLHPRCRCRLLPADFQLSIKVKKNKRDKVVETQVLPTPKDYLYVVKLKKSDLEKAQVFVPASVKHKAYYRYDPRERKVFLGNGFVKVNLKTGVTSHQLSGIKKAVSKLEELGLVIPRNVGVNSGVYDPNKQGGIFSPAKTAKNPEGKEIVFEPSINLKKGRDTEYHFYHEYGHFTDWFLGGQGKVHLSEIEFTKWLPETDEYWKDKRSKRELFSDMYRAYVMTGSSRRIGMPDIKDIEKRNSFYDWFDSLITGLNAHVPAQTDLKKSDQAIQPLVVDGYKVYTGMPQRQRPVWEGSKKTPEEERQEKKFEDEAERIANTLWAIIERNTEILQKAHDYQSTQVNLPKDLANKVLNLIKLIDPKDLHPTEKQDDDIHITVRYGLLPEVQPTEVKEILNSVRKVKASIVGVDVFRPEEKDYDVLILRADSPDLALLNEELKQLPNESTHPVYQPHITIAYLKRGKGEKYRNLTTGLEGEPLEFDVVKFSNLEGKKTNINLEKADIPVKSFVRTRKGKMEIVNPFTRRLAESGTKTLGIGISPQFEQKGFIDLRGKKVDTPEDVAAIAQIYRNPQYETLRYVYVRNGIIVGHEGRSSRIPGLSQAFVKDKAREFAELRSRIQRLGADTVWLVHNHPSGNPTPSTEDVRLTNVMMTILPQIKGHVIINSGGKYGLIQRDNVSTEWAPFLTREEVLKPALNHSLLGLPVLNKETVAVVATALKAPKNFVTLLYRSGGIVRAIQEIPIKMLSSYTVALNYLRGRLREFGSQDVIFALEDNTGTPETESTIRALVSRGQVTDAVIYNLGSKIPLRSITAQKMPAGKPVRSTRENVELLPVSPFQEWMGQPVRAFVTKSLEKARSHKYIRREGSPKNYIYTYAEPSSKDHLVSMVSKAIKENPGRMTHGYLDESGKSRDTGWSAFFVVADKIYPYNKWQEIPIEDRRKAVSFHSHSPSNWTVDEDFPPLNSEDIHIWFKMFKAGGMGNKDGIIMADGRMEILEITSETDPIVLKLGAKQLEEELHRNYEERAKYYEDHKNDPNYSSSQQSRELLRDFCNKYRIKYHENLNWKESVLVKAKSYARWRHGKYEHVKGYPGKPRLFDLTPNDRINRYLLDLTRPEVEKALDIVNSVFLVQGRALLVGGCVRDALLGRSSKDIDIEVYGVKPEELSQILQLRGKVDQVGKSFGVFKVSSPGMEEAIDVSIPRRESKVGKGHKGFMVEADPNMTEREAASRRDLTINSLAYDPIKKEIVDPFGGLKDLQEGKLRATDPNTFPDDSLRVLRVMRFAAQLGFTPDVELVKICRNIDLTDLPRERIFGELSGMLLKAKYPSLGLKLTHLLGIDKILPELGRLQGVAQEPAWHPEGDAWAHTLMVMDEAAKMRGRITDKRDQLVFMLATLCHDMGKPETTEIKDGKIVSHGHEEAGGKTALDFLARLTDEQYILDKVEPLVKHHMKPSMLYEANASDSAIRRLAKKVDIPTLVMVSAADKAGRGTAQDLTAERWLMKRFKGLGLEHPRALDPKVMGRHLIPIGIEPGPEMGKILDKIYEGQLEGKFQTAEEGIEYGRKLGLLKSIPVKGFTRRRKGKLEVVRSFERAGEKKFLSPLTEGTWRSCFENARKEYWKRKELGQNVKYAIGTLVGTTEYPYKAGLKYAPKLREERLSHAWVVVEDKYIVDPTPFKPGNTGNTALEPDIPSNKFWKTRKYETGRIVPESLLKEKLEYFPKDIETAPEGLPEMERRREEAKRRLVEWQSGQDSFGYGNRPMSKEEIISDGYQWRHWAHSRTHGQNAWDWAMWEEIQKLAQKEGYQYKDKLTEQDLLDNPMIPDYEDVLGKEIVTDEVTTGWRNYPDPRVMLKFINSLEGKAWKVRSLRQIWAMVKTISENDTMKTFPGLVGLRSAKNWEEALNTDIQVYRGIPEEKEKPTERNFISYTTVPAVADKFARGYYYSYDKGEGTGIVVKRTIKFGEILGFVNNDAENEVLVKPPKATHELFTEREKYKYLKKSEEETIVPREEIEKYKKQLDPKLLKQKHTWDLVKKSIKLTIDPQKAHSLITRIRKARKQFIPYKDKSGVIWAKPFEKGFILNRQAIEGDTILLKGGLLAKVTAMGKDGCSARDELGNKYNLFYGNFEVVSLEKQFN